MVKKAIEKIRSYVCNAEPSGLAWRCFCMAVGALLLVEIFIIGPAPFLLFAGISILVIAILAGLYYLLYRFALWAQSYCREKQEPTPKPTLMERVDQKISEQEGSE